MNPIILADNRFSDGTPTATDTATDYDVLNIRDLKSFTAWRGASSGTKYLTVDCATAHSADALGIFTHNLGTAAAAVSVESSSNGSSWTERLAAFTPTTDKAILKTFTTESARYWRVKIVTGSVAAQIAVCLLGERIEFPFPMEAPFTPAGESIEADEAISKTGQLLGTVVRYKPVKINASWKFISRTWFESDFVPFWENWASNLAPFFWGWDLTAYPSAAQFVRVDGGYEFAPSVSILGYYDDFRFQMTGVKE
jgi:hypothetical protein